jgi:hypothetical protein
MVQQYEPNPNIKLVLNGGQTTLDGATIPLEWHFSEKLIEKKPRYIVVHDHESSLKSLLGGMHYKPEHAYGFEVKDLAGFIQLHRPGHHCFVVMVFYGSQKDSLGRAQIYCTVKDSSFVPFDDIRNGMDKYGCMEITTV